MRWRPYNLFLRWFPELLLIDSKAARAKAWLAAAMAAMVICTVLFVTLALVAWPSIQTRCYRQAGDPRTNVSAGLAWPMTSVVGFGVALVLPACVMLASRRAIQRNLRQYLLDHGVPVCIKCGYSLRGLTEPRCPECGRELDPRQFGVKVDEATE